MLSKEVWEQVCFPQKECQRKTLPIRLEEQSRIVLYGAGYGGMMFLELLRRRGLEPECFLDLSPKKQGRRIMGVPVYAPDQTVAENTTVIVCLLEMGETFRSVKMCMMELGCRAVYHLYELRDDHALFESQPLVISPDRNLIWENRRLLYQAYQMLEDELSKQTLASILRFLWGDLDERIPVFPMEDQYFAGDIYSLCNHEVFVDCGAHVGEILHQFLRRCQGRFERYWAFEPGGQNIRELEKNCPPEYRPELMIRHTALGDRPGTVHIRDYDGNNSVIRENGEERASCATLDSFAEELHPTILKIDVEGWESRLLDGAETIIRRDKPVIAIAVYHREQDFWEIPLRLKHLVPEYRFYLRSYLNVAETVLYAVPPVRLSGRSMRHEIYYPAQRKKAVQNWVGGEPVWYSYA